MQLIDGSDPRNQQYRWRAEVPPIATVSPGDELEVVVPDSSTGQLSPTSRREALVALDLDRVDAAVGPFDVRGAEPGDAVRVEILSIRPGSWGWSGVFREFGLLRNRFEDDLVLWEIGPTHARPSHGFLRRVSIPLAPMLGWLGLAPTSGDLGMIPPREHGGNLDNRLHRAGTVLELPVQRTGGGLMIGDPHAAQGDGEVCGTGIETSATVRLRVGLRKGGRLRFPRAVATPVPLEPGPYLVSEGVGADVRAAAQAATSDLIEVLSERGWSAPEAYLLLSVAGHLRLSEVVDEPNWVVSALIAVSLADQVGGSPGESR